MGDPTRSKLPPTQLSRSSREASPQTTTRYECVGPTIQKFEENSTSVCLESGKWSWTSVSCEAVPCGVAPTVENSAVVYAYTHLTYVASYTCDTGYVFEDESIPAVIECSKLLRSWNGETSECVGISCGPAPDVSHATTVESGRRYPSNVLYTCNEGFVLSSPASSRTCEQDGNWSVEEVVCESVTCGIPSTPSYTVLSEENGTLPREEYHHGDNVTFLCEEDSYMIHVSQPVPAMIEAGVMTCLNGNWTTNGNIARCIPCNAPPDVPHATWDIQDEHLAMAVYSCEPGYNATGATRMTCIENTRAWHVDKEVHCDLVDCGEPPSPGNGTLSTPGTKYNDTVTYSCSFGYIMVGGNLERTCQEDGAWSGSMLQCVAWNCERPPELRNGTVSFTNINLNSTAVYTCNVGFDISSSLRGVNVLEDAVVAVCNDERIWVAGSTLRAELLFCEEIRCPKPPEIQNAYLIGSVTDSYRWNETVGYKCLSGYKHQGLSAELSCTEDGTWSFPFFECLIIDCGRPQPVKGANFDTDNGTNVGAVVMYSCHPGLYHASLNRSTECSSDGLWTRDFIECLPYNQEHCGDPPPIAHSNVEITSLQWTGVALYSCTEGYEHSWTNSFECSENFKAWVGNGDIQCLPVDCGQPPHIAHADAVYENTTLGSQVIYQCQHGRQSPNGNTKICTSEGSWSTELEVECLLPQTSTCGSPPEVPNSFRRYSTTTEGSLAYYTCNFGFTGKSFEASCDVNGLWEFRGSYSCLPVSCEAVPTVANSESVHVSGTAYGDVAMYFCIEGYTHSGSSMKKCEANGLWSSNVVECVTESSVICGEPPRIEYTVLMYESRVEGAYATYSCIPGYFGFATSSSCANDGQWSDPEISCSPIICDPPTALNYSIVQPDPKYIRYGRSIVHICISGYVSSSNSPLISYCLEDGSWSEPVGYCQPAVIDHGLECSNGPPVVDHVIVSQMTGTHVGSMVQYTCEVGYVPTLSPELFFITCLPDRRWSFKPLRCAASLCIVDPPSYVENAELKEVRAVSTFENEMEAVYICYDGYSTDGLARKLINSQILLYCKESGWPILQEVCFPVDCGPFQDDTDFQAVR
ncbi:sushi, von Willebrand factor type A, EGF and pentraxin domain-containing protein 1-like [Elysia marginata]|uniref:Sushi, von Willebrand factor type A, EGF and pentraxin domain-containing protein 1-like n=1 Tax=Elysia marginata TaxID=1093978 RepID=A0AAV4FM94_9GAST|nr:sushi, von Willebrand factor type A, EGF and pentraxin domain-containing protein 1-like [Elysia marginata]